MKKHLIGAVAATAVLSPIAAMAKTEVHFWHAFTAVSYTHLTLPTILRV